MTTSVKAGGPPGSVLTLAEASAFASGPGLEPISGSAVISDVYGCSEDDPLAPDFDCVGASDRQGGFSKSGGYWVLAPGESAVFSFGVSVTAQVGPSPVAAVPLPAGGLLLGMAMGTLGLLGRRRG